MYFHFYFHLPAELICADGVERLKILLVKALHLM